MSVRNYDRLITLEVDKSIWQRFFTVAPLVLIGTREENGKYNLAPKHMITPLGWANYFGFVCTPRHSTYHNIQREETFTVTYVRPSQVVMTSLAATKRTDDDVKPGLLALPTFTAAHVDALFLEDGYLFLECELDRIVDGFGEHSLIAGRIIAAHVDRDARRTHDRDDGELIRSHPMLAYLSPRRFACIEETCVFPFPSEYER